MNRISRGKFSRGSATPRRLHCDIVWPVRRKDVFNPDMRHLRSVFAALLIATPLIAPLPAQDIRPINDAPNPYVTISDFFRLPEGRTWGSTSAVEIDKDGKSVWIAERCGANSCLDRATAKMSSLPS